MYKFGRTSLKRLETCHPDLVYLLSYALATSPMDFTILEGARTLKKQEEYYKAGKSKCDGITKKSKHQIDKPYQKSLAVDLAPYPIDWENVARFRKLSQHIKQVAKFLGINVRWGGDFHSIVDMPHWELKE